MKNTLLDKGIITPSGEISKDKINLVAGSITQPFAEMVWVTTGGDMETINRLTDVLVSMNTPADRGKLFKIIKMLYGLMGLWAYRFPRKPSRWTPPPTYWNTSSFPLRQILAKSSKTISRKHNRIRAHRRRFSLPTGEKRNAAFFMPSCYAVEQEKALQQADFGARL